MRASTTSQAFFERKYHGGQDPWGFASQAYEQDRYAKVLRAISYRRYRRAFEPGCSIGVLTERLATLCDAVDAMDIAPSAVAQARERCRPLPQVEITCGALPEMPHGDSFDLILLSEIGYYFEASELDRLGRLLTARLSPSGVLLAAHWLGVSDDHLLHGDQVHEILGALDGLSLQHSERYPEFRIDRWVRA